MSYVVPTAGGWLSFRTLIACFCFTTVVVIMLLWVRETQDLIYDAIGENTTQLSLESKKVQVGVRGGGQVRLYFEYNLLIFENKCRNLNRKEQENGRKRRNPNQEGGSKFRNLELKRTEWPHIETFGPRRPENGSPKMQNPE